MGSVQKTRMVNSLTMKILVGAILLQCKLLNGQINFGGKPNELEKTDQPKIINETINTIKPTMTEEDILSPRLRILNSDGPGTLPQQVIIRTSSISSTSDCSGTMLTSFIAITAAHCVDKRVSNEDVMVYPPRKNCEPQRTGIPACKIVQVHRGSSCTTRGHDIALVRLSKEMYGMRKLKLSFPRPSPNQNTVMAGTGYNTENSCESLMSYQTIVPCRDARCEGRQWYCTEASFRQVGGACVGDSGGPSWTFTAGLTGLTASAAVNSITDKCTSSYSFFANLNYYKRWIKKHMKTSLRHCDVDVLNTRRLNIRKNKNKTIST